MSLVSVYPNVFGKNSQGDLESSEHTLTQVADYIRKGSSGLDVKTAKCRELASGDDKEKYRRYKSHTLPCFTPSGTFSDIPPTVKSLKSHSGFIVLDWDGLSSDDVVIAMDKVKTLPAVRLAYVSPSGFGIKAIFELSRLPKNSREHLSAWQAVASYAHKVGKVDRSGKDIRRFSFLAHDPNVFTNESDVKVRWNNPKPVNERKSNGVYNEFTPTKDWVDSLINSHCQDVRGPEPYESGSWKWQFTCPWDSSHKVPDAYAVLHATGAVVLQCSHDSCNGNAWKDFREKFGIEYPKPSRQNSKSRDNGNGYYVSDPPEPPPEPDEVSDARDLNQPEFPDDAFHGVLEHYRTAYEGRSEICDAFHFAGAITTVGLVLGRSIYIGLATNNIYPNIYSALVGPPAISRKSSAINQVVKHLATIDGMGEVKTLDSIASREGLIEELRTDSEELETGYPNEGHRLLVHFDELRILLDKSRNLATGGIIPELTSLYDMPLVKKRRKAQEEIEAKHPCVSLMSASTKSWIEESLVSSDIYGGFISRFMFFLYDRTDPIPLGDKPDESLLVTFFKILAEIRASYAMDQSEFSLDKEVEADYSDWYCENRERLELIDKDTVQFASARIVNHAFKISLILSALTNPIGDKEIHMEEWEIAKGLAEYFDKVNSHLFTTIALDTFSRNEQKILDKLAEMGNQANRRDVQRACGISAQDFNRALEALILNDIIHEAVIKGGRGRPTKILTVLKR